MVSTTANEATSYEVREVEKALGFLRARKAKVYVTMTTARDRTWQGLCQINTNRQALIAHSQRPRPPAGGTRPLAISNRLTTLLPEFGEDNRPQLHRKHNNQMLVTCRRTPRKV